MKKYIRFALALVMTLAMLLAAGCGSENSGEGGSSSLDFGEGVIYINDALYYTYYQAFNYDPDQYNGRKYAVDGMFHMNKYEGGETPLLFRYHLETDPTDGKEYAYYRGFMLKDDEGLIPSGVEEKTWIRVVGTLDAEHHDDHVHVYLIVESFELLDTPGSEYVI